MAIYLGRKEGGYTASWTLPHLCAPANIIGPTKKSEDEVGAEISNKWLPTNSSVMLMGVGKGGKGGIFPSLAFGEHRKIAN